MVGAPISPHAFRSDDDVWAAGERVVLLDSVVPGMQLLCRPLAFIVLSEVYPGLVKGVNRCGGGARIGHSLRQDRLHLGICHLRARFTLAG